MCLLSIIIPTFNAGRTLATCLDSIFRQTFADYEVLIQDGGSEDNTLGLLAGIQDPRVKVLSEGDKGVYDAMNRAVRRSSGSWLYFLGSDDSLFADDVLEVVADKLNKTESTVWYGNVKLVGNGGKIRANTDGIYRGYTPVEELFFDNICHQAMFYKASVFKEDHWEYELKYPIQADHVLNIKLASCHSFEYSPIVVANFQHGGISTQVTDPHFAQDLGEMLLRYYGNALKDKKFYRSKSVIKRTARDRLKRGEIDLALKAYLIYLKLKIGGSQ